MKETKTYYSIKRIVSAGCVESLVADNFEGYASERSPWGRFEKIGGTCFETEAEAIEAGKLAIQKKIATARKTIAKLEKIAKKLEENR